MQYARGHDELRPLSNNAVNKYVCFAFSRFEVGVVTPRQLQRVERLDVRLFGHDAPHGSSRRVRRRADRRAGGGLQQGEFSLLSSSLPVRTPRARSSRPSVKLPSLSHTSHLGAGSECSCGRDAVPDPSSVLAPSCSVRRPRCAMAYEGTKLVIAPVADLRCKPVGDGSDPCRRCFYAAWERADEIHSVAFNLTRLFGDTGRPPCAVGPVIECSRPGLV